MTIRVDAYIAGGIARGGVAAEGHLRDALDAASQLALERTTWQGPDDPGPRPVGPVAIPVDDIIVAVPEADPALPVHAVWHPVHLEAGPYVIDGEIPTMPGFDPGRALTRPAGSFVLLRDVRLARPGSALAGSAAIPEALVNRYMVDRVTAELMLGFFFPGAEMIDGEPESSSMGDPGPPGPPDAGSTTAPSDDPSRVAF
jgi:hypothetical protein